MTYFISLEMMPKTLLSCIEGFLDKNDQRAIKCTSNILAGIAEVNPDVLSIPQTVHLVMATCQIDKDKDHYERCESALRTFKRDRYQWLLKQTPTGFLGGLTTWMSPQDIDARVQALFGRLKKEHMIISESEFAKIKDQYREPGRYQNGGVWLDRLWGALYLKDKIGDSSLYKVPKYIIVVKNGIKAFSVALTKTNPDGIPIIQSLAGDDARVFVENIQPNEKVAGQGHYSLRDYGYVDFADPGNILKGPEGNYYIVDTEMSAFDGCLSACKVALEKIPQLKYSRMRCDTFNPWSQKIVKIKLDD